MCGRMPVYSCATAGDARIAGFRRVETRSKPKTDAKPYSCERLSPQDSAIRDVNVEKLDRELGDQRSRIDRRHRTIYDGCGLWVSRWPADSRATGKSGGGRQEFFQGLARLPSGTRPSRQRGGRT